MACKGAENKQNAVAVAAVTPVAEATVKTEVQTPVRLLFGVDSKIQADDILQNNISEFEWVVRNKVYPNFWGRNLVGENCLTKKEIDFLHEKGCKIARFLLTKVASVLSEAHHCPYRKRLLGPSGRQAHERYVCKQQGHPLDGYHRTHHVRIERREYDSAGSDG